jgi:hypothetical protein
MGPGYANLDQVRLLWLPAAVFAVFGTCPALRLHSGRSNNYMAEHLWDLQDKATDKYS